MSCITSDAWHILNLIDTSFDFILQGFGVNINSDAEPASVCSYGSLFGESTNGMLLETLGQEIRDVNEAVFILSTIPEKYSSASCLFRWTARSIKTAMEYYKLNEQCSDAIDLIRCHARAYNYLASFEPNLSRKVKFVVLPFDSSNIIVLHAKTKGRYVGKLVGSA